MNNELNSGRNYLADYAMAFDVIGQLTDITSETKIIHKIFSFYTILCSPKSLYYLPVVGGTVGSIRSCAENTKSIEEIKASLLELKEPYAFTQDGNGFLIKLADAKEVYGILSIDEIAFSEHKEHYLNISLNLIPVFILAILNARKYQEILNAEGELRNNEKKTHLIIDTAHDAFVAINEQGKIIEWNNQSEKTFEWMRPEIVGQVAYDTLFPEKEGRRLQKDISGFLRSGNSKFLDQSVEFVGKKKGGQEFPIEISFSSMKFGNENFFNAFIHDITIRKEMERQLLQVRKLDAISTLAGGIAHDFNNILFSIIGYAELLKADLPPDEENENHLNGILMASNRATGLVKQMLSFSPYSHEEKTALCLSRLIQDSIELVRETLPENVVLATDITDELRQGKVNSTQIQQILMNLVSNSCDAMPDGGKICLCLDVFSADDEFCNVHVGLNPGDYFRLVVKDQGYGMPYSVQEKVFEPFFTTKDVGAGTGLGLSAVHGIVKGHKGSIFLESSEGVGTTWKIFLPILEEESKKGRADEIHARGNEEHLMLVDDETIVTEVWSRILRRLGYQVSTFDDGASAFEDFKKNPQKYDLLITDMVMPMMSGLELFHEVRKFNSDIPVILCTGYSEKISGKIASDEGIDAYLMKPVSKNDLLKSIHTLLPGKE